ncbi:MAG: TetR/AcrR family transcriptional regulator [Promethearchaeota archaeon]
MQASTYLHKMRPVEERVLEAAKNLLVKHGYKATTTRRIARNAGVNEVTLFRKYKSKDRLIKAALAEAEVNAMASFDSVFDRDKDTYVHATIRTVGENLIQFAESESDLMILQFTEGLRRPSVADSLSSVPQMVLTHLTEYFQEQIERGRIRKIDPKIAALVFMSYVSYSQIARILLGDEFIEDHEKTFDSFLDVFTGGILESDNVRQRNSAPKTSKQ